MNNVSTPETLTEAQEAYVAASWELVDSIINRNPAIFAREHPLAVDIVNDKIVWNREGLFYMSRDPNSMVAGSDYSKLRSMLIHSIIEHQGYSELPHNFWDVVESFRDNYERTGEI